MDKTTVKVVFLDTTPLIDIQKKRLTHIPDAVNQEYRSPVAMASKRL
ncbi:hypothetical protein [Muribaculum gordoncarteri]